jgi:hypothetical protein
MWHTEQQRSFDKKKKKKNHLPAYAPLPYAPHPSSSAFLQLVQPSKQSCGTQNNKVKQSCGTQSNKESLGKLQKAPPPPPQTSTLFETPLINFKNSQFNLLNFQLLSI